VTVATHTVFQVWRSVSIAMGVGVLVLALDFALTKHLPPYRVLLASALIGYRATGMVAQLLSLAEGRGFTDRLVVYPVFDSVAIAALLMAVRLRAGPHDGY
jgi:hypothetical protein